MSGDLIDDASKLPINDAAYYLWRSRFILSRRENPQPKKSDELDTAEGMGRAIRRAIAKVHFDRDNAEYGPTFDRLKRAHPNERDDDLRHAVGLAVKLDTESYKNFLQCRDVAKAVEQARLDNPGFLQSTYTLVYFDRGRDETA